MYKAGHIPPDTSLKWAAEDDIGVGYVARINDKAFYGHSHTPTPSSKRHVQKHSSAPWRCSRRLWPSSPWHANSSTTRSPSLITPPATGEAAHACRADLTRAAQEGWQRSDYCVQNVTNILIDAASDANFAAQGPVDAMCSIFAWAPFSTEPARNG